MFNKQIRTKCNLFCLCFMNAYFVMFLFFFGNSVKMQKLILMVPKIGIFFLYSKLIYHFLSFDYCGGKRAEHLPEQTMMSQGAGLSVAWQRAVCQRACVWFWFFWDVYDMFCINVYVQLWCIISHPVEGSYEEIYFQTKRVVH